MEDYVRMALLDMIAIAVALVMFIICMGSSYIEQILTSYFYPELSYTSESYGRNPLREHSAHYLSWLPQGAVIITKKQWEIIEDNVGSEIAKEKAKGYKEAVDYFKKGIVEKRASLDEKKAADPYEVLDIDKDTPEEQIDSALVAVLDKYSEERFEDLDKSFVEFARLRRRRAKEAYKRIKINIDLEGACIG